MTVLWNDRHFGKQKIWIIKSPIFSCTKWLSIKYIEFRDSLKLLGNKDVNIPIHIVKRFDFSSYLICKEKLLNIKTNVSRWLVHIIFLHLVYTIILTINLVCCMSRFILSKALKYAKQTFQYKNAGIIFCCLR